MNRTVHGYWFMTWLGLLANTTALIVIGLVAFGHPLLQIVNITLAFSIAWPSAIVGIVASAGLLAERRWGVVVAIVALSMALSASLPYGIVRLVLVKDFHSLSGLSIVIAILNLLALIYWCKPAHRRVRRL